MHTLRLALAMIVALIPLAAPGQSVALAQKPTTLNVIFHGMFAFVLKADHIEAIAPQIDDHVYKAGAWGRELRLKEGMAYELHGVTPAAARPVLDPTMHVIVKTSNIVQNSATMFFTLNLPWPQKITGLRNLHPNSQYRGLTGASVRGVNLQQIPLLEVFTYPIADLNKLSLGPNFVWHYDSVGDHINLHVWAEPDAGTVDNTNQHNKHHNIAAFAQLMKLIPGVDLHPDQSPRFQPPDTDKAVKALVNGIEEWEEMTFHERSPLVHPSPDPTRGVEITNCIGVFVDTRN